MIVYPFLAGVVTWVFLFAALLEAVPYLIPDPPHPDEAPFAQEFDEFGRPIH